MGEGPKKQPNANCRANNLNYRCKNRGILSCDSEEVAHVPVHMRACGGDCKVGGEVVIKGVPVKNDILVVFRSIISPLIILIILGLGRCIIIAVY